MSPQFQAPRFSRQIAQLLVGIGLTIALLLVSSGPARTDDSIIEAVNPPICKTGPETTNVPNTAITAVYCAYNKGAPFGPSLSSQEEDWGSAGDKKRRFLFGTIYYVKQSNAAFALFNHVRDYYEKHMADLGKPITSEIGSQADGFCKAFFTGDKMLECHGVNNPIEVDWRPYLPELEMPFGQGVSGTFSGGPHGYGNDALNHSDDVEGSGLDIALIGDVLTLASGTVIEVEDQNNNREACDDPEVDGFGCWVAVRNDFSGTVIVYAHLFPFAEVQVGDWIELGSEIGEIRDCTASTCVGRSEGPHVHLELRNGRSSDDAGLWGSPLNWHGVTIGKYLFSGGYESITQSGDLGNVFDYDGTAIEIQDAKLDVHRLYTQSELTKLLKSDKFVFVQFNFNDADNPNYPEKMYAWMTKAAWDKCETIYNLSCENEPSYDGTVFSKGTLEASTARAADEAEPFLESSNVARPYAPRFSPPDDPSDPSICAPTADQVALYDDANYGSGKPCRLLNIGSYDSLGSLDNATSSVRVGANVKVTLYSEANRGGDSQTLTADDPDLANNEIIQRNEASSALVQPKGGEGGSCQPGDYQVALFDDVYFNPNKPCRVLALGDYSTLGDFDNIVSSIKVGSKVTLVLFENTGYGGSNETFYHDDYNLDDNDHIQKNETSSAKVLLRESGGYSYCNEEQNPGETEVILFDNPRYGAGPCAILKVGEYPDLSSISFENEASSLRVGGKVKVMVCTKKRFDESEESGGECETYSSHVPDLDETGEVPRDETSSAKVEMKLLCHPLADGVILYENSNYGGGCTTLTAGTWNLSDFRYDDMVSSLRFVGSYASGWSARLCQDANLGGTCSTFTGDDSSLSGDAVGNDRASSIALAPLPPASAPSLTEIANPEGLGTYQVSWTSVAAATRYELEEQLNGSAWANAYAGEATSAIAVGNTEGTWCYRARAINAGGSGPWSNTTICTTVAPPIPDPDLKVNALAIGNPSPTVGQNVTVEVEIRNVGQGTAGPSTCTLYEGDPAAGGTQITTTGCGTLSPDANSVVTLDWMPGQAGPIVLFAVADSGNALVEVDEANNQGSVDVTVQPTAATCYTLTRTHVGEGSNPVATPANSPNCVAGSFEAGTAITLTATPASGWRVKNWSGTSNDSSTSTTNWGVIPASNHTVGVTYELIPISVPTITGFTPALGPATTPVTIDGTNLTGAMAVTFNGTAATFAVVSATRIDATVPAGATTGKIAVTAPGGTATSASDFTVTTAGTWTPATVGENITGSMTETGDQVLLKATGGDLWSTADAFQFAYRDADGDMAFTVRLDDWDSGNVNSAKAGLTVRDSLDRDAPHVTAHVTGPNRALKLKWRTSAGANTSSLNGPNNLDLPVWLRFEKSGSQVMFLYSLNGTEWVFLATKSVNGADNDFVYGMVTASDSASEEAAATFVVPSAAAPTITGFAPTSGSPGSEVTITGMNLSGATSVRFNSVASSFSVVSSTRIDAVVPVGATTGKITVTTVEGTATSAADFTVDADLVASFSADRTSGHPPLIVSFLNMSTGEPTSCLWDFGDGQASDECNPTHMYVSYGIYTVSLTVSNELGSDTETKIDYIWVQQSQLLFLPSVLAAGGANQ